MKWKIYEFIMIMILPSIVIFLTLYYPYGFEKNTIAVSAPTTAPGISYTIYHGVGQDFQRDQNGNYIINQDTIERSGLSQAIIVKIFGSSLGLNEVCFHNIDSTYYYLNYRTNVDLGIRFYFNNNPFYVYSGNTTCIKIYSNTPFAIALDQGILPKDYPDIIMKNLLNDKDFQNYISSNHIAPDKVQLIPQIDTQVYVQVSPVTWGLASIVIFIVWSGLVFWFRDIIEFFTR